MLEFGPGSILVAVKMLRNDTVHVDRCRVLFNFACYGMSKISNRVSTTVA